MKLALVPVNVWIGDFSGNLRLHQARIEEAAARGAELVVFPELSLVGYSPLDLLQRPSWVERSRAQLEELHGWLRERYPKLGVVVGTTWPVESSSHSPRGLANAAVFLEGDRREVRAKTLLPDYDVFHELRHFDSSQFLDPSFTAPVEFRGRRLGLLICEDSWQSLELRGRKLYRGNPAEALKEAGCGLLVNLSASPYERGKRTRRRSAIAAESARLGLPTAYVNHYGAHDDLLFDGDCFLLDHNGALAAEGLDAPGGLLLVDCAAEASTSASSREAGELHELGSMLALGIRDYCRKNGFTKAVLGISGGIDSALVAALACEALGPENVTGLIMPSRYSSTHSIEDAEELARNAGFAFHHFPIKMPHSTFSLALRPFFEGLPEDATEENLQSRLRGVSVMAFANKFRSLALATGNRSEFAMGYSTLYGDMCGALAPIGDLLKSEVYELARQLNSARGWIPERSFTKAPSAELRPNQTDQDSLPPYDILDACLRLLLEQELEPAAALPLLRVNFPQANLALIERVARSLRLAEFKRRQAPPVLKVSARAFGSGRMVPVTCHYS